MDLEKIKDDPTYLRDAISNAVINMDEDNAYVLWKHLCSYGCLRGYPDFHTWIKRFAPTAFEAWKTLEEQKIVNFGGTEIEI